MSDIKDIKVTIKWRVFLL